MKIILYNSTLVMIIFYLSRVETRRHMYGVKSISDETTEINSGSPDEGTDPQSEGAVSSVPEDPCAQLKYAMEDLVTRLNAIRRSPCKASEPETTCLIEFANAIQESPNIDTDRFSYDVVRSREYITPINKECFPVEKEDALSLEGSGAGECLGDARCSLESDACDNLIKEIQDSYDKYQALNGTCPDGKKSETCFCYNYVIEFDPWVNMRLVTSVKLNKMIREHVKDCPEWINPYMCIAGWEGGEVSDINKDEYKDVEQNMTSPSFDSGIEDGKYWDQPIKANPDYFD